MNDIFNRIATMIELETSYPKDKKKSVHICPVWFVQFGLVNNPT